jgi:hypothetical protein
MSMFKNPHPHGEGLDHAVFSPSPAAPRHSGSGEGVGGWGYGGRIGETLPYLSHFSLALCHKRAHDGLQQGLVVAQFV